jgi:hypothetical protein
LEKNSHERDEEEDGLVFFLPIRARASDEEKLGIIGKMILSGSESPDRKKDEDEEKEIFKGAYLEGLILKGTSGDKNERDGGEEGGFKLPSAFRRVGKWETLAGGRFVKEVWASNGMLTEVKYGDEDKGTNKGLGYRIVIV